MAFSQAGMKWATQGNTGSTGDFVGTTNNFPLTFKVNNIERMSLSTTGILQVNSLAGTGTGYAWFDANGNMMRTNFPNDPNQILTGNGTFTTFSALGGWAFNGNNLYNSNAGYVGIGTNNPQFSLDVNGNARVNGTLYAMGLVLATKMEADTMKSSSMISVNNNLSIYSGLVNDVYTTNGDIRLQSRIGFNGNTILNAGTSGNVGVGIFSPLYKFDVNGTMRVSGAVNFSALAPANGFARLYIDSTGNLRTSPSPPLNCATASIYDWNLHGNYGTDPDQDYVGTCDNIPLIFRTNGNERMRISATVAGEVGIGNGHSGNTFFMVPQLGVGSYNTISQTGDVGIFWADSYGGNTNASFVIAPWSHAANPTGIRMTSEGKIGIGTANPQYLLDVGGTMNATQILENGFPVNQWTRNTNGDILFDVTAGGSVGIGVSENTNSFICNTTICPTGKYLLAVGGGIRAKSLKVEPLWSDYVFDPSYPLMPLDSVAAFIGIYHHLPKVPSAEDVKANGIDVGESQALLLAKIEELTLYMFQQQRQIAAMQKEIDVLKK